jgi:DNA repair protein RecN (Recombination protein N)
VRPVSGEERVAEVARMLSGTASATSLAHARELLAATTENTPPSARLDDAAGAS